MSAQTAGADTLPYMFDRNAETMPRSDLNALQLSRLKTTVERAYNKVPHYKRKFDAAGVKPGDLKSLVDLARFPFTVKADLRDNYPFGMFAVPREQLLRLHASSGTTGKPTVVGYTKQDLDTWANLMARCFACAGALPGDIVHNAYGYGLFTGGLGAHYGAERLGCTVVPISGGGTERQVTLIDDFKPSVLCATPSYALNIAEIAQKMGVDMKKSSLRVGLFGAEPWSDAMRRDLEARLGLEPLKVEDAALARFLEERGQLVRVGDGYAVSAAAYEQARDMLVAECEAAGRITLARFRDLLGVGRKTAQLLLERFDADGLTRRAGDERVLRRRGTIAP